MKCSPRILRLFPSSLLLVTTSLLNSELNTIPSVISKFLLISCGVPKLRDPSKTSKSVKMLIRCPSPSSEPSVFLRSVLPRSTKDTLLTPRRPTLSCKLLTKLLTVSGMTNSPWLSGKPVLVLKVT